jgi:hypothetical protein
VHDVGALTTNKETQYLPWQHTLYIGDGVYIYSATKWKPRISENINPIISIRVNIYLVYHIMVSKTRYFENSFTYGVVFFKYLY